MLVDRRNRLASIRALGGYDDVRLSGEQLADALARGRLVVHDDGLNGHGLHL
jgi:hypothetical protein